MSTNVMAWMAASKIAEPVVISVDDVCQCDGMDGIARPPEPADRTSTAGQQGRRPRLAAAPPRGHRHRHEVAVPGRPLHLPLVAVLLRQILLAVSRLRERRPLSSSTAPPTAPMVTLGGCTTAMEKES